MLWKQYEGILTDLDAQSAPEVLEYLQQDPAPVAPVAELAEVAERLLWTAHPPAPSC